MNEFNGNGYKYRSGPKTPFGIRPLYFYIAIGVLVLIGLWFISGLLTAGITAYFSLAAGILLVIGNLRDVIMNPVLQKGNTGLLNTLIGVALILFFVGSAFGFLWFIPAVLALLLAAPLMLGRSEVYATYMLAARNTANTVGRTISGIRSRP
ncbi:MAG: hypothetical protein H7Z42_01855 [Roseiflexaceae bacterium]|nr:hypothetical protein [Roseiflexaceae bacterium]